MIQKFDYYRQSEKPEFILCNPDGTELAVLTVSDTECVLRYNDTSELSFLAEESGTDGYDLLETHRQVFVENLGYFIIDNISEEDGDNESHGSKRVNAKSAQYELGFRLVDYLSGVYPFYDSTGNYNEDGTPATFMGYIMSLIPGWSLSYVDSVLESRYRSLEINKQTVLDVLYSTASKAYQCIFTFDFLNRTIRVDAVSTLMDTKTRQTDIYLSFDNVIDGMDMSETSDGIITKLFVYGQDLDIRQVNPLGTAYIVSLDYYKTEEWMQPDLIEAVNRWEEKVAGYRENYSDLLLQLREKQAALTLLQSEVSTMDGERKELDNVISVQIEQGLTNAEIRDRYQENLAAQKEIVEALASKRGEVLSAEYDVQRIQAQLSAINADCSMESNFTSEQMTALSGFLIEGEYTNSNYIVTDQMTAADIQDEAEDLYAEGLTVARRLSQPSFTLSVDSMAFIHLPEFVAFTNQLELGCIVTVEKTEDIFYTPILLEMSFSWDKKDDFSLAFGNRFHLNDAGFTYEELLGNLSGTSSSVNANWDSLVDFERNYKDAISSLLNNAFNVALHNIISSSNQDIIWDASGLACRKYNPETGTFEDEQFKIINNMIAFTDDGWNSLKTVVGKILLEDGSYKYGVAAEVLVGKLLAGNNLVITNEKNSFRIDENGVSFLVGDGETEEFIPFDEYIQNELTQLQEAVDGMVSTYWQEEPPHANYNTISKNTEQYKICMNWEGDIWYDTVTGETKRYTVTENADGTATFRWEIFADTEIPEELWDTIDGKKTIYTSAPINGFSKDDLWLYEGTGTVQESTSAKYRAPYDSAGNYFEKADLLVATADSETYNPALWKKYSSNIDKSNGNFEFHLNETGMSMKNGTIQMDTGKNTVKINPTDGIKILKNGEQKFWADADGNLHLAGNLEAATGTFTGKLEAATGTFTGKLEAASGTFKGTVQAEDFLDADGNSMLNTLGQFKGDYLELKGITVRNTDNEITFQVDEYGNVTLNGDVTVSGDTTFTWEDIQDEAASAADDAVAALANGEYSGGTFISGTSIYSPNIYTNDFKIIGTGTMDGQYVFRAYYNSSQNKMMLQLNSQRESVISAYTLGFSTSNLNLNDCTRVTFGEGVTVDFTGSDVLGLDGVGSGGVAKFG